MLNRLRQLWAEQQFMPGRLGPFLNPFYFARKGLYRHLREFSAMVNGNALDVGCGQKPYRDLFRVESYLGLEIDTTRSRSKSRADVFYDGNHFPFADREFDSVISNQVFEHVFNPTFFLSELHRVLKPGGTLLMTVPFIWDEHEQPHDFARYTSFGLRQLVESHGFEILEQRKSVCGIRAVLQVFLGYLYKSLSSGNVHLDAVIVFVLFSPVNLIGELLSLLLPDNDDIYLDNIVLARKGADA